MIPDDILIDASRLQKKKDIIQRMQGDQTSPEAQRAQQRKERLDEAPDPAEEAKAAKTGADAGLSQLVPARCRSRRRSWRNGGGNDGEAGKVAAQGELALKHAQATDDSDLAWAEFQHKRQMDFMSQSPAGLSAR